MPRQLDRAEQEQLDHLNLLLSGYQRKLRQLEGQASSFGDEKLAPIFVINQLDDTRKNIERIKREIGVLEGAPVTASPPMSAGASAESAPATSPRKLSPNQRTQLARLLLECPSIKDAPALTALIDGLAAVANTIARDSAPLTVVIRLVNECLNHDRGLADLLAALRASEGDSIPMRNVELFLKSA